MCSQSEIQIRLSTPEDLKDILYGLRTFYWPYEPVSCGCKIKTVSEMEEGYYLLAARKGVTLLATDPDQSNKIVGFLTIMVSTPEIEEEFRQFVKRYPYDERLEAIHGIFDRMDRETNIFERYKVNKMCQLYALSVDPKFWRRAVGTKLIYKGLEVAESQGCQVLIADCTSYYSTQVAQHLGMKMIGEMAYNEYVDANGEQILKPPSIHTHLRRFVKTL